MSELATAFEKYKAGDYSASEKLLRDIIKRHAKDPKAQHLFSIVLKSQKKFPQALKAIDHALILSPNDVNVHYEKVQILMAKGDISQAVSISAKLLAAFPDHLNASIISGNYWLKQDFPERAHSIFEKALKYHPSHPTLLRGQIFALKDTQNHEKAWEVINKISNAPDLIYTKGQLYLEGFEPAKAILAFEEALNYTPRFSSAAREVLQCAFMSGGIDKVRIYVEKIRAKFPLQSEFNIIVADVFNEIGLGAEALEWVEKFEHVSGVHFQAETTRSSIYINQNNELKALDSAKRALALSPEYDGAAMQLAKAALMANRPEETLTIARKFLNPNSDKNSFWTAMEATALKLMGKDKAYKRLIDYESMIGVYDLEPPQGYESLEVFLEALKIHLLSLHEWQEHPLFQSLRQGTQTSQDLRHSKHPVLQSFFKAIEKPIENYIASMPNQSNHPFFGRKKDGFRFSGAWSVALRPGGYHVNHIHPKGWISSSFYVDVPDSVNDSSQKSGWIQFGQPPFNAADIMPEYFVCPKAGRLVLFPSYMWHGTVPFTEGVRRLTLPFDVMPLDNSV